MNPATTPVGATATPAILDPTWLLSILVGFFLPWLIAKIQSGEAGRQYRSVFAFIACLTVGILVAFLGREFVGEWGASWYDNLYLIVFNVATLILTAWQSYSRLWVNIDTFRATNNDPKGFGDPKS